MELERGSASGAVGPAPARRSWFRRESVSIAELGVQTFAVVLGILLALAIDDWRKERETRESTAAAMSAIRAELETNSGQVAETHERAQPLPIGFCRGVVDELAHLNDNAEAAYAKAIKAAHS
ncbi:MAG TPA: hypothetical protein VGO25_04030 [Rhodanobacteraceae bacterium]|nr:hypothetical protein [Rhodanobacteraceae bacterium]